MDSCVHDHGTPNKHDPVKACLDIEQKTNALERKIEAVEEEQETVMVALDVGGSHRGLWTPGRYLKILKQDIMKRYTEQRRILGNLVSALKDLRRKESQLRDEKLILMRIGLDNGYTLQYANKADETTPSSGSTRSDTSSQADTDSNCSAEHVETPYTYQIFMKQLDGNTGSLQVSPTDTVLDLKAQVQHKLGYSPDNIRIIFAGTMLEDTRTLEEYHIYKECTIHAVGRLRGGKPIILLYPPTQLTASVRLTLGPHWTFSTLYPKPRCMMVHQSRDSQGAGDRSCQWKIHASPDGTLREIETKQQYPYLFWEADSEDGQVVQSFYLKETPSFCVPRDKTGALLDEALTRLGLNARERCDMITYWLLQLEAYPFNVIYFVDAQRYAQAAELTIVPNPDVVIRVFMAFRGVETYDATLDTAELEALNAPARDGFVVVEWGGMNLNGPV